eukprot:GHVU01194494.1.p1 GENE.GHVU01194494.1~~GHVU01194494.1.p1  ORF type:complete len:110 (+),score=1.08 GHVU01194494.1:30-332(+)
MADPGMSPLLERRSAAARVFRKLSNSRALELSSGRGLLVLQHDRAVGPLGQGVLNSGISDPMSRFSKSGEASPHPPTFPSYQAYLTYLTALGRVKCYYKM